MLKKETLEKVIKTFENNDVEGLIASFHENGTWEMVGQETINGHDGLRQFFGQNTEVEMLSSTRDHVVISGDTAVVDGQGKCKDGKGNIVENFYCDIYEFEGDKVKSLRSFVIDKK
ncbi:MAG: nuclear transport factor 2 family protein [Chitinophagaceae bacterium]|nr:MAG: nuclear transport factor 2 family protein [Chitinophagaceae bacterium]